MDIRYRFPFKSPFILEDAWPLESRGAVIEMERVGQEVTHIIVTFKDQPVSKAPQLTTHEQGKVAADIRMRDDMEVSAVQIVKRFQDFFRIHHTVEVDLNDIEVEFIPRDDVEKAQVKVFSFRKSSETVKTRASFSMVAQALFASESADDPSFASSLIQMARQASMSRQYIEAFRYCFLLFEAMYGDGKFKTAQLVDAMLSNSEFQAMVERTIHDILTDPLHRDSKSKQLVKDYPTARAVVTHLVEQRGFYFHGNIKRKDTWRPDEQNHAEELADFCMFLGLAVTDSMGAAMFAPEIGKRYFDNATKFGAIMTVIIRFKTRDDNDFIRDGSLRMPTPATVPTNALAMAINLKFLEWAQTELHGTSLVQAVANDEDSGKELFRSNYLSPAPAKA